MERQSIPLTGMFIRGAIGALTLIGMAGCTQPHANPPPSGPLTATSDTQMVEPVMSEFLDPMVRDAAAYLSATLPGLPEVAASKKQFVFAIPQTLKIDGQIPDARIEQALTNLRVQLQSNSAFSDSFLVLNATEVQAKGTRDAMQSDSSAFRDPLQGTADRTKVTQYDPAAVYNLTGRMYAANDPGTGAKQLNFTVEVSKMLDRTPVATKQIIYNLQWDGKKWVRAA